MARPARKPSNTRGQKIVAHLARRGFTTTSAAREVRLHYDSLMRVIHEEPAPLLRSSTIKKLTGKPLKLPLALVAPDLA